MTSAIKMYCHPSTVCHCQRFLTTHLSHLFLWQVDAGAVDLELKKAVRILSWTCCKLSQIDSEQEVNTCLTWLSSKSIQGRPKTQISQIPPSCDECSIILLFRIQASLHVLRMQMMFVHLVRSIFPSCLHLYIISEFPSANLIIIQLFHCNEITIGWFPRLEIHRLEQIIGSSIYAF